MLPLSFFVIALLYATVGFGGGSSYLALLSVSGVNYELIPKLGLICNLVVVSGGSYLYFKKGYFNKELILPFVLSSVPMAFLGGLYPIKEKAFIIILATTLILSGVRLLFVFNGSSDEVKKPKKSISIILGGLLGFLSGLVGIGGGIFLAPILLNLRWGTPKQVAAAASFFIFLNSIAGLIGQLSKAVASDDIFNYWPLFLAVLIGGQLGSRIGTHPGISQQHIQRGTAILILFIAVRLVLKVVSDY